MSFDYETPSDSMDDAARILRAEELARIIPGLSSDQLAAVVERWCFMLGSRTSMDDVDRGTFADFRAGLKLSFDDGSALV
ncbi:hypothetical protein ABIB15_002606 [Marisediminicola sp. UYEF4]|uniref:hypothetical protein n=1 Tax=Marisediminicola sp. UYEF4 TaxID=1756384 RepID=UPI00339261CD